MSSNKWRSKWLLVVIGWMCSVQSARTETPDIGPEVCYNHVGCFSMTSPWSYLLRPLPPPQAPDVIDTRFYLYTRKRPDRHDVATRPDVDLWGSGFDARRETYVITHGFTHDGNYTWLADMKDALLEEYDANVFIVDWGKGSQDVNYFQAASNIRVVAKEVVRLAQHLVATHGAKVSRWHLIGHSLGAHTMSYVAKSIPGMARLTALDPAQPAFEGYSAEVRLDSSDALFVDVVHTNARPFIPLVGLGMMAAHGHVDYYMNGGMDQPGCIVPPAKLFAFSELAWLQGEELMNYVACPHQRSYEYFTAAIRNTNCTFWGRRLQDILFNKACEISTCIPLGISASRYPARGSFNIPTSSEAPFCTPNKDANEAMGRILPHLPTTPAPSSIPFFETPAFKALFPWLKISSTTS